MKCEFVEFIREFADLCDGTVFVDLINDNGSPIKGKIFSDLEENLNILSSHKITGIHFYLSREKEVLIDEESPVSFDSGGCE